MRAPEKIDALYDVCNEAARALDELAWAYNRGMAHTNLLVEDVRLMGGVLRVTAGGEIASALLLQAADDPDLAGEYRDNLHAICRALHWVTGTDH